MFASQVAFRWTRNLGMPHGPERPIQADALETVIEPNGPAVLLRKQRQFLLSDSFKPTDCGKLLRGDCNFGQ